jgi:hypothetical protein
VGDWIGISASLDVETKRKVMAIRPWLSLFLVCHGQCFSTSVAVLTYLDPVSLINFLTLCLWLTLGHLGVCLKRIFTKSNTYRTILGSFDDLISLLNVHSQECVMWCRVQHLFLYLRCDQFIIFTAWY